MSIPPYPPGFTFNKPMSVVFIGNIPYDTTEEQLLSLFSTVGPVQSLRLVFDRDTGKPKGYGFCEYQDTETARSCVRNLSNYELNGRNLRLDFADSMLGAPKDIRKENKAARIQKPVPEYVDSPSTHSYWDPLVGTGVGAPTPMIVNSPEFPGQQFPTPPLMMIPPGIQSAPSQVPFFPPPGSVIPPQPPFMPPQHLAPNVYPSSTPYPSQPYPIPNYQAGFPEQIGMPPPSDFGHFISPPPPPVGSITALEALPPDQLFSLISHIKNMTQTQPAQAKELLMSNPHLSYALFHILWRMDLIDPQTIQRTISSLTSGTSEAATNVEAQSQDPRKGTSTTSNVAHEQHQMLLEQIRKLTPEQIDALPAEQREKILLLKNKV